MRLGAVRVGVVILPVDAVSAPLEKRTDWTRMTTGADPKKEANARAALQELGLEIADRWASGFEKRPTQQLVLQKIIEPAVRHVLNSIFPWIVGVAILFLVLLVCTVVTTYIVLRSGPVAAVTSAGVAACLI